MPDTAAAGSTGVEAAGRSDPQRPSVAGDTPTATPDGVESPPGSGEDESVDGGTTGQDPAAVPREPMIARAVGDDPTVPLNSPVTATRLGALVGVLVWWWQLAPWRSPGDLLVRNLVALDDPVLDLSDLAGGAGNVWDLPGSVIMAAVGQVTGGRTFVVLALAIAYVALGAGTARLAGTNGSRVAGIVAAMAATWNPWVFSRLAQGDWWTVVAFACLPWVVIHLRADHRWRLARCALIAGLAGGPGWLVVLPTLLIVSLVARRLKAALPALLVLAATILPALFARATTAVDPAGFEAMAVSADMAGGRLLSAMTGGGHWNPAAAPSSRGNLLVALVALVITVAGVWGAGRWRQSPRLLHDWRTRNGFLIAAVVGLVGSLVLGVRLGQVLAGGLADTAGMLGGLRSSGDLSAPWVLAVAIGLGHLSWRLLVPLRARLRRRNVSRPGLAAGLAVTLAGSLAVVAALPTSLRTTLPSSGDVPASWELVARVVDRDSDLPVILVVPGERDGTFDWAGGGEVRVALNSLVEGDVLIDRDWQVVRGDTTIFVDDDPDIAAPQAAATPAVPGAATESEPTVAVDPGSSVDQDVPVASAPSTLAIAQAADGFSDVEGSELARAGIQWVALLDQRAFGAVPPGMRLVVEAPEIQLLEVDPSQFLVADIDRPQWPLLANGVLGTLALGLLLGAGPLRGGRELDPV